MFDNKAFDFSILVKHNCNHAITALYVHDLDLFVQSEWFFILHILKKDEQVSFSDDARWKWCIHALYNQK
jgi:hypothetical protein